MLRDYLPVLLQIIVAVGFAASALIVSVLLGKAGRRNRIKDSPYECGMVSGRRTAAAIQRKVLPDRDALHSVRPRNRIHVPVGGGLSRHDPWAPGHFLEHAQFRFHSRCSDTFTRCEKACLIGRADGGRRADSRQPPLTLRLKIVSDSLLHVSIRPPNTFSPHGSSHCRFINSNLRSLPPGWRR